MAMIKFLKNFFDFRHPRKQLLNLLLLAFLISFSLARTYSLSFGKSLYILGFQVHHFYFGMLTLSVGGVIGLLVRSQKILRVASVLIGVGIGLFADEIGLLLNCTSPNRTCAYAFPDTLDIIGLITLAIIILIMLIHVGERYAKTTQSISPTSTKKI